MQEYLEWSQEDIIDIAIENWNPQEHQQELLTSKPSITTAHMVMADNSGDDCDYSDTKTYDRDSSVHIMNALADADVDPLDQFLDDEYFDSEEDLFFNAEEDHSGESDSVNEKDPDNDNEDDDLPHLIQCVKANSQPQRSPSTRMMATATACMTISSALNAQASTDQTLFHDASDMQQEFEEFETLPKEPYYFDPHDPIIPARPGKAMHLTFDYQTMLPHERGRCACFTRSEDVDAFLSDIDYDLLVDEQEVFNTMTCALSTVEKLHELEVEDFLIQM